MATKRVIIIAICLVAVSASKHDKYSGYSLHQVATSPVHSNLLHQVSGPLDLDFWRRGVPGAHPHVVMVPPQNEEDFLSYLDYHGIPHSVIHQDVKPLLDNSTNELRRWQRLDGVDHQPFNDYPRYAEVVTYLKKVAHRYPELVELVHPGNTFEGRPIYYVKISTSKFENMSKPIFYLDATIHAREWVTTPIALYSIHRLVEQLQTEDVDLLRDIDWIILPVVNPDGYEYTHTKDRLWRKTRSLRREDSECYGVDANRNFDYAFGTYGVTDDPCEDIYPGPHAFSEPEAAYVRDIIVEHLERMELYVTIHSYGNTILTAYGDETLPPNNKQIFRLAKTLGSTIDARKLPEAPNYQVGNSATLHYPTSGSAPDYAQLLGVPVTLTLELPDYGYEFEVPPSYLRQVTSETWPGLAAAARLARLYYDRQ